MPILFFNSIRVLSITFISLSLGCSTDKVITIIKNIEGSHQHVPAITTKAADRNVLRFVAMGDTGTGKPAQFEVARALKQHCATMGCDFILLLGDNIYEVGAGSVNDGQFETKFELPYKDIPVPFHLVLGNHDYGSGGVGLNIKKGKVQVEYSNKSTKWKMPHHYYQYTINNALFMGLDTQAQLLGADRGQRENVSRWINESNAGWKIAYGHHPYRSNGPHGNAGNYNGLAGVGFVDGKKIKQFADDVWCGKVDLYISGHDHSRQWLKPTCAGTQLIVSGAGAKQTSLPGSNQSLFQNVGLGFVYVVIKGNTLRADFIDRRGSVEFSHTLSK